MQLDSSEESAPPPDDPRWLWVETLALLLLFLMVVLFIDPRGDMPLNDDWNFALATWHFADTGQMQFSRFTGMSLRLQVVWGALWTIMFGKSFEVLRAATLTLSLASILTVHRLAFYAGLSRMSRLVAAVSLLLHPVFLWSSFTFMTHVPYVFLSILALFFNYRALRDRKFLMLIIGSILVVGSYFIRQTGIVNSVPVLLFLLLVRERFRRDWWLWALMAGSPLVLFGVLHFGSELLSGYPGQIDIHYDVWQTDQMFAAAISVSSRWLTYNSVPGALFLLPLAAGSLWLVRGYDRLELLGWLSTQALFILLVQIVLDGQPMPRGIPTNIFVNFGIGPLTLRDSFVLGQGHPYSLGIAARTLLTLAASFLAAHLLFLVGRRFLSLFSRPLAGALLAHLSASHAVAATGILFVSGVYFDRYTIDSHWALVLFLPPLIDFSRSATRIIILAMLLLLGAFSVLGVQEYLNWNRARWEAFRWLRHQGVSAEQMDGGYEINQFLLGGWHSELELDIAHSPIGGDDYILTLRPLDGWTTVGKFPYRGFFGHRDGYVYILRPLNRDSRPDQASTVEGSRLLAGAGPGW